jgi:hypothetical protein
MLLSTTTKTNTFFSNLFIRLNDLNMAECNYVSLAFMILAVLLIVMLPDLTKAVPQIRMLFTNNVNFMLLLTITICIILLDMPSGIMFALWVIYGTYYYQRVAFTDVEVTPKQTEPDYNVKLSPLVPSIGDIDTSMLKVPVEEGLLEPFTGNMSSDKAPVDSCCNIPITTTKDLVVKSRSGYDVVGCRMDGMMAAQNTTMYGPPLSSSCYLTEDGVAKTSTGWYPINP